MKRLLASPRRAVAVGALMAVAVAAAASYGYAAVTASNNSYTGCLQGGVVTGVAIGDTPTKPCPNNAVQISWSQTGPPGQNGANGVSVTSATEPAGSHCANGGSKFTAANGVTYACNGANGDSGGASLAALNGSPCTTARGNASTVVVTVNLSGTVDISCIERVNVSASFSGGSMDGIAISGGDGSHSCHNASACSTTVPLGHPVDVIFHVDNRNFEYTCPGESPQPAGHLDGSPTYFGECYQPAGLDGDYIVTGSFLQS